MAITYDVLKSDIGLHVVIDNNTVTNFYYVRVWTSSRQTCYVFEYFLRF